jgi:hypothetical protein
MIVHAVIGAGGWAVVVLAAIGLVVAATAIAVSARSKNGQGASEPAAVPVWWDQIR